MSDEDTDPAAGTELAFDGFVSRLGSGEGGPLLWIGMVPSKSEFRQLHAGGKLSLRSFP